MYSKRAGTSGISGQLYESKLISLLYFRALHDDRIKQFKLASNINNIGDFDDICFRADVDGFDKPVVVFIQAKHRENKNQILKIDLYAYFNSYLRIRQCFDKSKEKFFEGSYDQVECFFVFYTTAKDQYSNDWKLKSNFSSILNDLVGTDGKVKQPDKRDEDVKLLCKVAMKEQITSLAQRIANFINNDSKYQMMMTDDLVRRYHVILAEKVVNVSELQPDGYRFATFRHDFFDTHDEYLVLFKNMLFKEILKSKKTESVDIKHCLSEFLKEPGDASKLSKLIGIIISYNNDQLEFNKQSIKDFEFDMKLTDIPPSTVNKAIEIAAKEILLSPTFKQRVPSAFGNKDITLSGSEAKKKRRINYLASKITDLFVKYKSSKIIAIDESLDDGFLQLNGGVAGGIGNIFVVDDSNTKLMKITNDKDSLGIFAKQLYERLNEEIELNNKENSENKIPNLCEYKFSFNSNKFPKLSFECSENEHTVTDFLNKLVIFSSQADEEGVETILKNEIEENQLNEPNYFQAKIDAIFAKFHDEIQKWWIQPEQAPYLTEEYNLFKKAKHIIKDQLVSVVNFMYKIKINHFDSTFTENAVKSLNFQDQVKKIITTENTILTVVKVIQHLNNKSHIILDLEYIMDLPTKERKVLCQELRSTHEDTVLILVCDEIQQNKKKILETISGAVLSKNTIIVTKRACVEILQKYFPESSVHDDKNSFIDLSDESQKSIMENAKVVFQGTEVRLDLILDDKSKTFVKGDILHKIINKEKILVGTLNVSRDYNDIKYLHVERRLKKAKNKSISMMPYLCTCQIFRLKEIYETQDSYETLVEKPSCSSQCGMGLSTPYHTPKEITVKNRMCYNLYFNEQNLSTDVISSIEYLLTNSPEEKKEQNLGETLKTNSSPLNIVVEDLDYLLNQQQKNAVLDVYVQFNPNNSGIIIKPLTIDIDMTSELPPDHVVLVLAEPGVGKSTLLTNLSIKTKGLKPEVWIIRINLLEYSEEFSKWKDDNTTINLLETLKFICQVIIRDRFGKNNNVEILLEETNNIIYLKHCTADPLTEFELNLFLHFYYEREILFLFDGFDEICPHYTNVVIKCLRCIGSNLRKHRMWITSRPYNEVKFILEKEFGSSYEIDTFSEKEIIQYLHTFWKHNLRLEELSRTQLENLNEFREYMEKVETETILVTEPLHVVNIITASYLDSEIKKTHVPCYNINCTVVVTRICCFIPLNPLSIYLAAMYILDNINEEHKKTKEWYSDTDTFTVYKRFLEIKIKRRYTQKNEYNMKNPDTIIAYEREISESIFEHKLLGAFVIFNQFRHPVFSANALRIIEDNLKVVEVAKEKTGLIESVSNGVPIFTHMSFTEHFAVEYVCDRLKRTKELPFDKNKREVVLCLNLMFIRLVYKNIRKIFDHKLKTDKTLMSILEDNSDAIFHYLWTHTLIYKKEDLGTFFSFPLFIAVGENLKNCELLFRKTISHAIFYTNITDIIGMTRLFNMFDTRNYNKQFFLRIFEKYKKETRLHDDFVTYFFLS
ncbi:hypothetical protein PYW08_005202 [Mythimna loreyi]|uniref:Uncharacterized protein n=1 Tax=Mythimna loreyi TaxID=667449 RepID=A0ACC2QGD5_9NEOP|nr:hypothetical protein PYW08_005202 [Mythimna loreyi]